MTKDDDANQEEIMEQVDTLFDYLDMCVGEGVEPESVLAAMVIVLKMIEEQQPRGTIH